MSEQESEEGKPAAIAATAPSGVLRRMVTNAGMLLSGRAVEAVLGIATLALAMRSLGIELFGIFALVRTVADTAGHVLNIKVASSILAYGVPRLREGDATRFRRLIAFLLRIELIVTAAAIGITVTAVFLIGPWFDWPDQVLLPAAAYMAVIAFQMPGRLAPGILRVMRRFDRIALLRSAESLGKLLGTAVLWIVGSNEIAAFLAVWFAAAMISGIGVWRAAYRELRDRGLLPSSLRRVGSAQTIGNGLWRFIGMTKLNGLVALPAGRLGVLMLGSTLGASAAGLFEVASRLARAVANPVKSMRPAIGPEIAELLAAGSDSRLRRLIFRAIGIAAGIAALCFLGLLIAGKQLLQLIGGAAATEAYTTMLLVTIATSISLVAFPFPSLLNAAARPGWITAAKALNTALYVAVFLAVIPIAGMETAGIAAIIGILGRRLTETIGALPLLQPRQ